MEVKGKITSLFIHFKFAVLCSVAVDLCMHAPLAIHYISKLKINLMNFLEIPVKLCAASGFERYFLVIA